MSENPYEVLGVEPDASEEEITAAYKAKAKEAHPDGGGSTEEFNRIKQASLVLLNPAKRHKFDRTGSVDENKPDNVQTTAMEKIANFMINSINATLNNRLNLAEIDLVKAASDFFGQSVQEHNNQITQIERQIEQFNKVLKRLKSKKEKDVIKPMLQHHTAGLKGLIEANHLEVKIFKAAIEILKDYEFDPDPDAALKPQISPYQTSARAGTWGRFV